MKHLLLLALAATAAPALAQVQLGVRAGVSAASLAFGEGDFPSRSAFDDRLGLTGGVTAELPLSEFLALRTELVYTMKGGRREVTIAETLGGTDYDVTLDLDYALDYVELPVLLVVNEPTPYVDLALFAGPTLSLNVREKVDGRAGGTLNGQPITDEQAAMLVGPPPDRWVEATDLGATLGTRAVRGRLSLETRFTLGLPVVGDRGGSGFGGVKNRAFAFSVGYAL